MGKFGKNLAPVVAVFAIVALVMSYLVAKQGKLFRQRAEILAEKLSETAKTLDSGSGDAQKAAFTKSGEDGSPESGPLGWPDFAQDAGAYEQSAGSVNALAKKVVAQRDAIIESLVDASKKLEVEGKEALPAENLQALNTYGDNLESIGSQVDAWVNWKENAKAKINELTSSLNMGTPFQGNILEDGSLGSDDSKTFAGMVTRIKALKMNSLTYRNIMRELAAQLTSIQLR